MKKIIIIGKLLINIPKASELSVTNVQLFAATNLEEVKKVFENNSNQIDIAITGAGIDLEKRLEIVQYIFTTSNTTSVHMKDRATGPEGFLPFINNVLIGILGEK